MKRSALISEPMVFAGRAVCFLALLLVACLLYLAAPSRAYADEPTGVLFTDIYGNPLEDPVSLETLQQGVIGHLSRSADASYYIHSLYIFDSDGKRVPSSGGWTKALPGYHVALLRVPALLEPNTSYTLSYNLSDNATAEDGPWVNDWTNWKVTYSMSITTGSGTWTGEESGEEGDGILFLDDNPWGYNPNDNPNTGIDNDGLDDEHDGLDDDNKNLENDDSTKNPDSSTSTNTGNTGGLSPSTSTSGQNSLRSGARQAANSSDFIDDDSSNGEGASAGDGLDNTSGDEGSGASSSVQFADLVATGNLYRVGAPEVVSGVAKELVAPAVEMTINGWSWLFFGVILTLVGPLPAGIAFRYINHNRKLRAKSRLA